MNTIDVFDSDFDEEESDELEEQGVPPTLTGQEPSGHILLSHQVCVEQVGTRLDKLASGVFSDFSRASLQKFIETGELTVNGDKVKPKYSVKLNDVLKLTTILQAHSQDLPENITLNIAHEDDDVLVINKPCGMVVHPGAGNRTGTLVNALLYHYPNQAHLPRAGLVHRIDKDTTGLLVVAKTATAQLELINQLKDKSVYRHYQCVVVGTLPQLARLRTIDAPIARHATHRTKMAVRQNGKTAITHIKDITPLNDSYCLLDVVLETGRTHQIRVHLSHYGHPLVGDKTYGTTYRTSGLTDTQKQAVNGFARQALHAYELGFIHPSTGEPLVFFAPLPDDIQQLIAILKGDKN